MRPLQRRTPDISLGRAFSPPLLSRAAELLAGDRHPEAAKEGTPACSRPQRWAHIPKRCQPDGSGGTYGMLWKRHRPGIESRRFDPARHTSFRPQWLVFVFLDDPRLRDQNKMCAISEASFPKRVFRGETKASTLTFAPIYFSKVGR